GKVILVLSECPLRRPGGKRGLDQPAKRVVVVVHDARAATCVNCRVEKPPRSVGKEFLHIVRATDGADDMGFLQTIAVERIDVVNGSPAQAVCGVIELVERRIVAGGVKLRLNRIERAGAVIQPDREIKRKPYRKEILVTIAVDISEGEVAERDPRAA